MLQYLHTSLGLRLCVTLPYYKIIYITLYCTNLSVSIIAPNLIFVPALLHGFYYASLRIQDYSNVLSCKPVFAFEYDQCEI